MLIYQGLRAYMSRCYVEESVTENFLTHHNLGWEPLKLDLIILVFMENRAGGELCPAQHSLN